MRIGILGLVVLLAACGRSDPAAGPTGRTPTVATFSIVARDPATGDLGVAVQSRFFGVGSVVPYVRADVGAVATQALAEPGYGPEGLDRMDDGVPAPLVVEALVAGDGGLARRQVAAVDARGRVGVHTGSGCAPWAGHVVGAGYSCQGNILAGEGVVKAMAAAYEQTQAPFPERLVAALRAGQAAGGDKRGRQSAALMVARRFGGYRGRNDRWIDLRVEDHPTPIAELTRLLALRRRALPASDVPLPAAEDLVREPRVGTSSRPSARAVWRRWKALHAAGDWAGIRALCVTGWSIRGKGDTSLEGLARLEGRADTPQARARRGVYLGTAFDGDHAWLEFALPGEPRPVRVLLVREKDGWRIIP